MCMVNINPVESFIIIISSSHIYVLLKQNGGNYIQMSLYWENKSGDRFIQKCFFYNYVMFMSFLRSHVQNLMPPDHASVTRSCKEVYRWHFFAVQEFSSSARVLNLHIYIGNQMLIYHAIKGTIVCRSPEQH